MPTFKGSEERDVFYREQSTTYNFDGKNFTKGRGSRKISTDTYVALLADIVHPVPGVFPQKSQ